MSSSKAVRRYPLYKIQSRQEDTDHAHNQKKHARRTYRPFWPIYNYEIEHGTATFDLNPKTLEERQKWFDLHSGGKYLLLVAEEDGEAVGYASLFALSRMGGICSDRGAFHLCGCCP